MLLTASLSTSTDYPYPISLDALSRECIIAADTRTIQIYITKPIFVAYKINLVERTTEMYSFKHGMPILAQVNHTREYLIQSITNLLRNGGVPEQSIVLKCNNNIIDAKYCAFLQAIYTEWIELFRTGISWECLATLIDDTTASLIHTNLTHKIEAISTGNTKITCRVYLDSNKPLLKSQLDAYIQEYEQLIKWIWI